MSEVETFGRGVVMVVVANAQVARVGEVSFERELQERR